MFPVLQSAFGFLAILGLAWLASENRRVVAWRTVIAGVALQIAIAAALLKIDLFKQFFLALNNTLLALEKATQAGTSFVFGYLGGAASPYVEAGAGSSFVLAFRALPRRRPWPFRARGISRAQSKAICANRTAARITR